MHKKSKRKNSYFKASLVLGVFAGFVAALLLMVSLTEPVVDKVVITERSQWKPAFGDFYNETGASGVVALHVVQQGQNYHTNMSNTSGYYIAGYATHPGNNTHISSTVNHSIALDIVIEVRWNKTHAWETSNNTWMLQYINCTIHNAAMGIDGTCMDYNITDQYNSTQDFLWVNHVINCSALSRGQTVNGSGSGWTGILCNFTYYG